MCAFVSTSKADSVSVDLFYDDLSQYGDWVEVGDYGYCWHPRDVANDWRPYNDGNWVYTDAGWTWVSQEPYGWAVYHYGRWLRIEDTGWVWVPGSEWAPAWVSWRRSPKYVGWAPLPPEATFRREVGFSAWVDSYYDIGPTYYSFVEIRNLGAPDIRTVTVSTRENITIINETTNITKITYVNNTVYNGGPAYDEVSRVSVHPIRQLRLERTFDVAGGPGARGDQMRARVEGDSLRVMAPVVNINASVAPKKVGMKIERVSADRGWNATGAQSADVEKLHAKIKSEAKPPAQLPAQPKFERAAAAGTPPAQEGATRPGETSSTPTPAATAAMTPAATPAATATAPGRKTMGKPGQKMLPGTSPGSSPAAGGTASPGAPKLRKNGQTPRPSATMTPPAATSTGRSAETMANPEATAAPTASKPGKPGKNGKHPGMTPASAVPTAAPTGGSTMNTPASTPAGKKLKGESRNMDAGRPTPPEMTPGTSTVPHAGKKNAVPAETPVRPVAPSSATAPGGSGPTPPVKPAKQTAAPGGEHEKKGGHGKPVESGTATLPPR